MKCVRSAVVLLAMCAAVPFSAQQKGQWVPGQFGLNGGVVPEPGFTYQNLALNYSASKLNDANGNTLPGITGTYAFWVDENIFMYVPKKRILGGYFAPYISLNMANGSLVAQLLNGFGVNGGGSGFADTLVSPVNFGWHLSRADLSLGYAFVAPTGRFKDGASDNIGSGYWGHNVIFGNTVYLTKNKGTSLNLLLDWETHGKVSGTEKIPGQAVTTEWGIGQALPLDKQMTKSLQVGFVGYDQWQVTDNSGPTSILPRYSVHGLGVQSNFMVPAKGLSLFFKFYDEVSAKARPEGRTFVFGGSWTLMRK